MMRGGTIEGRQKVSTLLTVDHDVDLAESTSKLEGTTGDNLTHSPLAVGSESP